MNLLIEQSVECPYCGETIDLLIDDSVPQQNYIEDCPVCCRPINVNTAVDTNGSVEILATSGDE